ncbi:hypothetical protein CSKR_110449 [Clonorchis sinensis]|uniref:Uncharacterized protein n=1 Tax=Clonorchis sinensis TaxID=79923 RepID=A0A419Q0T0_CLOSI|nr:hypothetical protein CSKR_110449 [Clonorchis sinensis]
MSTVGLVANAPSPLDTSKSTPCIQDSVIKTQLALNNQLTTNTDNMENVDVGAEEQVCSRDVHTLERGSALSPQLNYIPPGLKCQLSTACGGQPTVCAVGRFVVGHIWGPYLVHLSQECKQSLHTLGEQSPGNVLKIAVKNSNCPVDETTIVLGEEHMWIKLLHESGIRMNQQESNVDLVLDPSSKTITLIVTRELDPNDMLYGALSVRPTPPLSLISSNGGMDVGPQQPPGNSSKGLNSPTFQSATTSGCISGPKRDKKCTYCGIPFSNVDTLTAHMTHYCSKRPKAVSNQILAPPCSATTTDTSAISTTSPIIDAVDNTGTTKFPYSNTGLVQHRSSHTKRPASRVNTFTANIDGSTANALSNCFTTHQMLATASSDRDTASTYPLGDSLSNMKVSSLNPILSTLVLKSLGQLSPNWISPSTAASTLLPFLNKISAATAPGKIHSPPAKRQENAGQPLVTISPESQNPSTSEDVSLFLKGGLDYQAKRQTEPETSGSACDVLSWDTSTTPAPVYCIGCQRYFASNYLYICHLQMSTRLLRVGNVASSPQNSTAEENPVARHEECSFQSVAEASARLGLVLTAPLFTATGLQFVPVHPACGLLNAHQPASGSPRSPGSRSVSAKRTESHGDQPDRCPSTHQIITNQTAGSVLDLSCTSQPEPLTNSLLHSPGLVSKLCATPANSYSPITEGCVDNKPEIPSMAYAQGSGGRIDPTLVQFFAQLLGTSVNDDVNIDKKTLADSSNAVNSVVSQSSNSLPQLMAQLYLATVPSDVQRFPALITLPKSPDQSVRTELLGQSSHPLSCTQSGPNRSISQAQASDIRQNLGEIFPAFALLNSIYPGTRYGDPLVCSALLGAQKTKNTTTSPKVGLPVVDRPSSPPHSPQPQVALQRPYLCTYCQTRFQAFTTFQAHQQYYCQARREVVRNTVGVVTSQPQAGATPADSPSVSVTSSPPSNSLSPGGSGQAKRRRIAPINVTPVKESQACKTGNQLTTTSSNHSSASGSGDEADNGQLRTTPGSNKHELTGTSSIRLEASSNESDHTSVRCEPCGTSELRCIACGYVGQTPRGMKMHRRLHECNGGNLNAQRDQKAVKKRPHLTDKDGSGIEFATHTQQPIFDRSQRTSQTPKVNVTSVKSEPT